MPAGTGRTLRSGRERPAPDPGGKLDGTEGGGHSMVPIGSGNQRHLSGATSCPAGSMQIC
jgi:hypothetical protein